MVSPQSRVRVRLLFLVSHSDSNHLLFSFLKSFSCRPKPCGLALLVLPRRARINEAFIVAGCNKDTVFCHRTMQIRSTEAKGIYTFFRILYQTLLCLFHNPETASVALSIAGTAETGITFQSAERDKRSRDGTAAAIRIRLMI